MAQAVEYLSSKQSPEFKTQEHKKKNFFRTGYNYGAQSSLKLIILLPQTPEFKTILKKNKVEELTFSNFKTYYKTEIKQCGTIINTEIIPMK
jgi:hypothetical protein